MTRGAFLRRTVLLVLATLLLSALLTAAAYFAFAQRVYVRIGGTELLPVARTLARMVEEVEAGLFPQPLLVQFVQSGPESWGARILVFDAAGAESLGLFPRSSTSNAALLDLLAPRVRKVLDGGGQVLVQSVLGPGSDLLVVAVPVTADGKVAGAVLLVKSMTEVRAAMGGLNRVLLLSMSAAFLLMLPPAYLASRRLVLPVRRMQAAADAMARGDFTVQADERAKGELGALAASLNHLSQELSKTLEEISRERNRLALILDGLSEGIVAVDAAGAVSRTNPALSALAGPAPESAPPAVERIPGLREDLSSVLSDGRPRVRELPLGERTLRISASPLHDAEGAVAGAVALVRDTTEAARLEKARRDYVSNVSHEFRTPVSSLRGLLEPLRDGLVREEKDRVRYYSFMLRETERLTRLIDDLLELSRLQSRTAAFEAQPFRLDRLYGEIAERFRRTLDAKEVRLDVAPLPEGTPAAFGNPDRVEQVLVALVDNAVRFTAQGGAVRIRTSLAPARFRVTVEDDGPGIAPEALPHVFDRFYKAPGSRDGEGSGLGLSIAREVLRGMGQEISASSEPGQGAAFTFTLARADVPDGTGAGREGDAG